MDGKFNRCVKYHHNLVLLLETDFVKHLIQHIKGHYVGDFLALRYCF